MEVIEKYKGQYTGEEIDELLSRIPLLQMGGTGGGDKSFAFMQENPEYEWEITHNLGKYPSVTVVEYYSNQEVVAEVEHISINKIKIRFSESLKGKAYLN